MCCGPSVRSSQVTKSGLWHQSFGSLLASWSNWLYLRRDDRVDLWTVIGTSRRFYDAWVKSMPRADSIRTSARVESVECAQTPQPGSGRGAFEVTLASGEVITADRVVVATDGRTARRIITCRGLWETLALGQVAYEESDSVLHTDTAMHPFAGRFDEQSKARSPVYHVRPDVDGRIGRPYDNVELTGRLSHLQGNEILPELLVTVNPIGVINESQVLHRAHWRHVRFDLWHLIAANLLIKRSNAKASPAGRAFGEAGGSGVLLAGEYTHPQSMGHNAAIATGIWAACALGIPTHAQIGGSKLRHAYQQLVDKLC